MPVFYLSLFLRLEVPIVTFHAFMRGAHEAIVVKLLSCAFINYKTNNMQKFLLLLAMVFTVATVSAQNRTVTGRVTDEKGAPVANASVLEKGTSRGVTTGADGNFSLSVTANAKTLVISSLNFSQQEVDIAGKNSVSVSLQSKVNGLNEVVVVAYGTQKKADLTGAIVKVGGEQLENRPQTSFDKMLQGSVAGLQSMATSGQPGSSQSIRIRGFGSISASNQPLYVVDGIPITSGDGTRLTTTANLLSLINPNDIENVTVLKDASASSIYGSLAANGVILVTTKKGKAGKPRIRFDVEVGQNQIGYMNDRFRPMNSDQYVNITREGMLNSGMTLAQAEAALKTGTYGDYTRGYNTDWFNLLTRKGTQQQYNLSISGGNDKSTYFISGGYYNEDGTTIQSNFKRYTASIRGKNFATPKLTISHDLSFGFSKQQTPSNGTGFANPVYTAYVLLPTKPAFLADGSYNINTPDFPAGSPFNTLYLVNVDKRNTNTVKVIGNVAAEYKILDDLKFTSRFGTDYNNIEEVQFNNGVYGDGAADFGRAYSYYTRYFSYTWTNFLDYKKRFLKNDALTADVKLGYEAYSYNYFDESVRNDNLPPNFDLYLASNGSNPKTASSSGADKKRASAFSQVSLNYEDKYVLSGSFRRDGSSVFGVNKRYGNFWSVGASWNVDRERFMESVDLFTQLKLRASYGVNGNENGFGNYSSLQTYGYGVNYTNQPGSAPNNVGDPNLTWEQNKPLNIGVDVAILKNKLRFSLEYYSRKTTNLLLGAQTSRTTGFASYTTNIGSMVNKGWELTIGATPIKTRDFTWDVNFNIAANKNRVLSLYQDKDVANGAFVIRVGEDVQTYYTRLWAGVDPANGDPLWYTDATRKTTTNTYNSAQLTTYKSASPKFFGGFSNSLTYKGFNLSFDFYYNFGNYVRDALASLYFGDGTSPTRNKLVAQLDRWQKPGDITNVPKYILNGNRNSSSFSSRYLAKGDYIRLRNIQLGYELPKNVAERLHMNALHFYVRGTNLWTWIADKNLSSDPEQGVGSTTNGEVFIPKSITVGLNLTF